ncbi:MAG: M28 family peptidase, partial [Actinomycetota bacterium]
MRIRRSAAALAVLAGLSALPSSGAFAGHAGEPYFDLGLLPATDQTGKQIFDGLKQFVNDFPYRLTGTANEIRAGKFLHDEMEALGYDAQTCSVPTNAQVFCDPNGVGAGLKAVMATKRGTTRPDEWIMFIGHYDTVPQTIYGAYDNGAGSNFIRFMAREFANVQTNRSLVFVWYNGEEEGLL